MCVFLALNLWGCLGERDTWWFLIGDEVLIWSEWLEFTQTIDKTRYGILNKHFKEIPRISFKF
jgi:hypothetical protein